MARQIGKTMVPDELYNEARAIRARGGKCFLATAGRNAIVDTMDVSQRCSNCHSAGHVMLQMVTGGPLDSAPGSTKDGETCIFEGSRWYLIRTRVYSCPICRQGIEARTAVNGAVRAPAAVIL